MAEQNTSQAQGPIAQAIASVQLLPERELAFALGFKRRCWQFEAFLAHLGIEPVPGRPGFYDPKLVRARLDAVQPHLNRTETNVSLTEERRKRRGKT